MFKLKYSHHSYPDSFIQVKSKRDLSYTKKYFFFFYFQVHRSSTLHLNTLKKWYLPRKEKGENMNNHSTWLAAKVQTLVLSCKPPSNTSKNTAYLAYQVNFPLLKSWLLKSHVPPQLLTFSAIFCISCYCQPCI